MLERLRGKRVGLIVCGANIDHATFAAQIAAGAQADSTGGSMRIALVSTVLFLSAGSALAQTREAGPWWPNPTWGKGDQAAASNWITPEKVLEAARLVKTGKIYEIGQVYEKGMPMFGARTYVILSAASPTYSFPGKNRIVGNDEFLCAEIGQVGTQFDGPGHIGMKVTMAGGSVEDIYYNGFTGAEMYSPYGLRKLGVENVKPMLTRGLLIDLAGYKGLPNLPARYEVTLADVRGALARQGLSESDIRPGDALLFRYGWARFWTEPATYTPTLRESGSRSRAGSSSARPRWWGAISRERKSCPTPIPAWCFRSTRS